MSIPGAQTAVNVFDLKDATNQKLQRAYMINSVFFTRIGKEGILRVGKWWGLPGDLLGLFPAGVGAKFFAVHSVEVGVVIEACVGAGFQ